MSEYQTDEEKAEALKKWWKENGLSVAAGVLIGLGAIFGWRTWIGYRDSVAQQASAAFEQLLASADAKDTESALAQSKLLADEYSSTVYATLTALVQAQVEFEAGNLAGAHAALDQAIASSPDPGIARIAALRKARILITEGDLEAAANLVEKHDQGDGFSGAFAAVRGDIALAHGRTVDARAAYEEAVAAGAPNPNQLRLKLESLGPAG